jgi:hypothetical protein
MLRSKYHDLFEVASHFRRLPGEDWNEVFLARLKACGLRLTFLEPHQDEEFVIQAPDPATDGPHGWKGPAWVIPDTGLPPVATQVADLKETLRLFREFYNFYVTQTKIGSSHHHPIWQRVAEALGDDNNKKTSDAEYAYITGPYWELNKDANS